MEYIGLLALGLAVYNFVTARNSYKKTNKHDRILKGSEE